MSTTTLIVPDIDCYEMSFVDHPAIGEEQGGFVIVRRQEEKEIGEDLMNIEEKEVLENTEDTQEVVEETSSEDTVEEVIENSDEESTESVEQEEEPVEPEALENKEEEVITRGKDEFMLDTLAVLLDKAENLITRLEASIERASVDENTVEEETDTDIVIENAEVRRKSPASTIETEEKEADKTTEIFRQQGIFADTQVSEVRNRLRDSIERNIHSLW